MLSVKKKTERDVESEVQLAVMITYGAPVTPDGGSF